MRTALTTLSKEETSTSKSRNLEFEVLPAFLVQVDIRQFPMEQQELDQLNARSSELTADPSVRKGG